VRTARRWPRAGGAVARSGAAACSSHAAVNDARRRALSDGASPLVCVATTAVFSSRTCVCWCDDAVI